MNKYKNVKIQYKEELLVVKDKIEAKLEVADEEFKPILKELILRIR